MRRAPVVLALAAVAVAGCGAGETELSGSPAEQLAQILATPGDADGYRFGATDDRGRLLDALEVVAAPAGGPGYLGVAHSQASDGRFRAYLYTSSDLLRWRAVRLLDRDASQPTLQLLDDGSALVAWEADRPSTDPEIEGNVSNLVVAWWKTTAALLDDAAPDRQVPLPREVSFRNEGTPSFRAVVSGMGSSPQSIELEFHAYQPRPVKADRQAIGTLRDLDPATWEARLLPAADEPLLRRGVRANIGDRDRISFGGRHLVLREGERVRGDNGSWRSFVLDPRAGEVVPIELDTPAGSHTAGNPQASIVPAPDGNGEVVAFSLFLFAERAAPGEAGPYIGYRRFG